MSKRLIYMLFVTLCTLLSFGACSDDVTYDPSSAEPGITFPYDDITADLNLVDNLPIVAIVKSDLGLKSVSLSIRNEENELIPISTTTDFFNKKSFSLSEAVSYKANYREAVVTAVDMLDRVAENKLPISIIDVVAAPTITRITESIDFDESTQAPEEMPNTQFQITSVAGIREIVLHHVKADEQIQYGPTITFTEDDTERFGYNFDSQIQYDEFSRSFKIKATDFYGQVRIETISVKYKTVPPPALEFSSSTIYADKDENKAVAFDATSAAGIKKVEIFRTDAGVEGSSPVFSKADYAGVKTLNFSESVTFLNSTSQIRVVVTDLYNRSSEREIAAIVNMVYVASVQIGSNAGFIEGHPDHPNVYSLFSFKDMKTYKLSEVIDAGGATMGDNIDFKLRKYGGDMKTVRISANDKGNTTDNHQFVSGTYKLDDFIVKNNTRFILYNDIDFDTATAETIKSIPNSSIIKSLIHESSRGLQVGDVIAFRTGTDSAAGPNKIGIMKIIAEESPYSNKTITILTFAIKLPKDN